LAQCAEHLHLQEGPARACAGRLAFGWGEARPRWASAIERLSAEWPRWFAELKPLVDESRQRTAQLDAKTLADDWVTAWWALLFVLGERLAFVTRRYRTLRPSAGPPPARQIARTLRTWIAEHDAAWGRITAEARTRGLTLHIPWTLEDPAPWRTQAATLAARQREAGRTAAARSRGRRRSPAGGFIDALLAALQHERDVAYDAERAEEERLERLRPATATRRRRGLRRLPPPRPKVSAEAVWRCLTSTNEASRALARRAARDAGVATWEFGKQNPRLLICRTLDGRSAKLTYKAVQNRASRFRQAAAGRP
jgi:hypothetical protein